MTISAKRQIYATGNNRYFSDNDGMKLFQHILNSSGKPKPRVCIIPTASGDSEEQIAYFKGELARLNCEVQVLSLFRGETADLESLIMSQDIVYVSGGNTRNMLVLWKEWGLDTLVRKAYESGIIFAGGSAGCLCWFEEGVTDSVPGPLTAMKCMGILKGSNCPHYDGEITRRPRYHHLIESGELGSGLACEDGVALYFLNEEFQGPVSGYTGKFAYQVELKDGKAVETAIPAKVLS